MSVLAYVFLSGKLTDLPSKWKIPLLIFLNLPLEPNQYSSDHLDPKAILRALESLYSETTNVHFGPSELTTEVCSLICASAKNGPYHRNVGLLSF